jgi:hypothetical protein
VQFIQRGIDRGELPKSTDPDIISDLISAPRLRRLITFNEKIKPYYIESMIDAVIVGANAVASKRTIRKK